VLEPAPNGLFKTPIFGFSWMLVPQNPGPVVFHHLSLRIVRNFGHTVHPIFNDINDKQNIHGMLAYDISILNAKHFPVAAGDITNVSFKLTYLVDSQVQLEEISV